MQKYLLKSFLNYALKSVGEVINTFGRLFAFGQFCRFGCSQKQEYSLLANILKKSIKKFSSNYIK